MAHFHRLTPFAGALLLACFAQAQAQTANRSVVQVPPRPAPTTTAPTPATAPATSVPVTPRLDGTVLMPATAVGRSGTAANGNYNASTNPTAAMGAGGGPNAPKSVPSGAGPYTALQLAESFLRADSNRDGELTRAEFQRLTIAPASFEEMDRDRNGVVTRSEYDDGSR